MSWNKNTAAKGVSVDRCEILTNDVSTLVNQTCEGKDVIFNLSNINREIIDFATRNSCIALTPHASSGTPMTSFETKVR